jgi:membrane peptidoglycan carboxypeptidase
VRRRLWLVAAGLAAAVAVVVVLAWSTSPGGTSLGLRLHARLRATHGRAVALSRVAPWLRDAVVATEDERFYRHHGIDGIGVLRALPYDLVHLSFAQGASTITEQVAKVLYLNGNDHSLWRKLEDAAVAVKLEGHYDKEQILGAYLNSVYFGEDAYGVWRASRRYFGVSPRSLDLAQASMLAGLIQAPSAYDPLRDPASARARQVEVLRAMVADGFTTGGEAATALGRSLRLRGGVTLPPVRRVNLAPGPAFVWWQLALGAVTASVAVAALLVSRLPRFQATHGTVAIRAILFALCVLGAAVAVRSFRTA